MPPDENPRFLWFQGATVRGLRDRLNAIPDEHIDNAIFKVNAPFNEHATLEVEHPAGVQAVEGGGLNEAHICPPVCP